MTPKRFLESEKGKRGRTTQFTLHTRGGKRSMAKEIVPGEYNQGGRWSTNSEAELGGVEKILGRTSV